jgi:hypothetical protein
MDFFVNQHPIYGVAIDKMLVHQCRVNVQLYRSHSVAITQLAQRYSRGGSQFSS